MGEMDGAGTCDVLCSPWCHPAASGLWPKLAELPVTIIQVPPGGTDRFLSPLWGWQPQSQPCLL